MIIPKIMHRIWIGTEQPEWVESFGQTWKDTHPDWAHCLWTDNSITELMPMPDDTQRAYDMAEVWFPKNIWQFRSDLLRYHILWLYGGVYVDADFYALRSIEPLIAGTPFFAVYEEQGTWVANGLMGSVNLHPLLRRLLLEATDGASHAYQHGQAVRPARVSGPQMLTKVLSDCEQSFKVLDQSKFFPYRHNEVKKHPIDEVFDDPELYAVHIWHNQRRERGLL